MSQHCGARNVSARSTHPNVVNSSELVTRIIVVSASKKKVVANAEALLFVNRIYIIDSLQIWAVALKAHIFKYLTD